MKYANIENRTNKLLGWYDKRIHLEIPTPNIEVTDEVWQEALNINANCYENGKFIFKDFRTEEEKEKQRVQNINSYTQSFIYSKYPQPKQSSASLGVYDESYKNEMVAFIKRVVDLSNEATANGTKAEDINWEITMANGNKKEEV